MTRLLPLALLLLLLSGCKHVVVTPPQCPAMPVTTVTLTPAQVGKPYLLAFAVAPQGAWTLCGNLPSNFTVTAKNGSLWLAGTPTIEQANATFKIWIGQ